MVVHGDRRNLCGVFLGSTCHAGISLAEHLPSASSQLLDLLLGNRSHGYDLLACVLLLGSYPLCHRRISVVCSFFRHMACDRSAHTWQNGLRCNHLVCRLLLAQKTRTIV